MTDTEGKQQMTIDMKWFLPAVLPFLILVIIRVLWWVAGAHWSEPTVAAETALILGIFSSVVVLAAMIQFGIKWNVRIGRRHD